MQYRVPQNVEREDQIVGPLTLKQVIVCVIGFGIAYFAYIYLAERYGIEIWLPPVAITVGLTAAFAFVKINDIPFGKWLMLLLEYFLIPRRRVWVKGADVIHLVSIASDQPAKAEETQVVKAATTKNIRDLATRVDNVDFLHKNQKTELSPTPTAPGQTIPVVVEADTKVPLTLKIQHG